MAGHVAADTDPGLVTDGNMVLVASTNGTICSVLNASDSARTAAPDGAADLSVDDLWPEELAATIRGHLKRTIRSRQVVCDEIENPADGNNYEFIFVAQGRDRVLVIVRDISQQKTDLSRIRQLAYTDEVTALPNREFLFVELQKIVDNQRLKEGRAAVICIHLHRFDDQGHALTTGEADEVLKELASRLTAQIRGINSPSETDYERLSVVARTDFHQFGVVLPSIETGEDAEAVVVRLLQAMNEPVIVGARTVSTKVNAGIALFPQDGTDAQGLYESAATAMEDAKGGLSTPYEFHSGTVRLRLLQRQDLSVELQTALDRKDYELKFLPILDANTGGTRTVEALLRWPETILGSQSTRKIVKIAEHTGLIIPIGEWVLTQACEQLQAWLAAGHENLRVAVNLSAQEFSRADLVTRIEEIVLAAKLEPGHVELEINEHLLFRDAVKGFATCRDLKSLGFKIVLDDYGTGTCSLANLSQSPVDAIKIDNSFVVDLESNRQNRAACSAAIALAHNLGMEVIAEGVETEGQADFLREEACDFLQGFLFCEPLNSEDASRYLGEPPNTFSTGC